MSAGFNSPKATNGIADTRALVQRSRQQRREISKAFQFFGMEEITTPPRTAEEKQDILRKYQVFKDFESVFIAKLDSALASTALRMHAMIDEQLMGPIGRIEKKIEGIRSVLEAASLTAAHDAGAGAGSTADLAGTDPGVETASPIFPPAPPSTPVTHEMAGAGSTADPRHTTPATTPVSASSESAEARGGSRPFHQHASSRCPLELEQKSQKTAGKKDNPGRSCSIL